MLRLVLDTCYGDERQQQRLRLWLRSSALARPSAGGLRPSTPPGGRGGQMRNPFGPLANVGSHTSRAGVMSALTRGAEPSRSVPPHTCSPHNPAARHLSAFTREEESLTRCPASHLF